MDSASQRESKRRRLSEGSEASEEESPAESSRKVLLKHLPLSILSLPHVARSIDVMLMSAIEAAREAARTGQINWMTRLRDDYEEVVDLSCVARTAAPTEVVERCIDIAAERRNISIIQIFLGTGRISQKAYEKVFYHVSCRRDTLITEFLFRERRPSSKIIMKCFWNAVESDLSPLVNFFHEEGCITSEKSILAFEVAASCNRPEVVATLLDLALIPTHVSLKHLQLQQVMATWKLWQH
ncbi:unnamed protein product [Phytophthora lilii]|uniref:Unnamed protein product n=1 Tax=Phytophthora lilii TaxID=2077276 RepID=A0A9W6TKB6_9STRA|nr:unnamed protein product [Phytophthora lilii]